MSLAKLAPAQKFMYDYGCFMAFWSNFDIVVEVAIGDLAGDPAKVNCGRINGMTTGQKKNELVRHLKVRGETAKIAAVERVFDVAERNDWVHGHILNPNRDFTRMTRLRIEVDKTTKMITSVKNDVIDFTRSAFEDFYAAYDECMKALGLTEERCNAYIRELQK